MSDKGPSALMVIRYVYDMSRAVDFHRDGLGLKLVTQASGWSLLSCGESLVGLHAIYKVWKSALSRSPVLIFASTILMVPYNLQWPMARRWSKSASQSPDCRCA